MSEEETFIVHDEENINRQPITIRTGEIGYVVQYKYRNKLSNNKIGNKFYYFKKSTDEFEELNLEALGIGTYNLLWGQCLLGKIDINMNEDHIFSVCCLAHVLGGEDEKYTKPDYFTPIDLDCLSEMFLGKDVKFGKCSYSPGGGDFTVEFIEEFIHNLEDVFVTAFHTLCKDSTKEYGYLKKKINVTDFDSKVRDCKILIKATEEEISKNENGNSIENSEKDLKSYKEELNQLMEDKRVEYRKYVNCGGNKDLKKIFLFVHGNSEASRKNLDEVKKEGLKLKLKDSFLCDFLEIENVEVKDGRWNEERVWCCYGVGSTFRNCYWGNGNYLNSGKLNRDVYVEKKLGNVEKKLGNVEKKLGNVEKKIEVVEQKLGKKIEDVEQKLGKKIEDVN